MSDEQPVERPTVITVICVLMGIGAVLGLPAVFLAGSMVKFPGWYMPFVLVSAVVGLVCMVGLWKMKKWGVFLYTGMFAVGQVVMLVGGLWGVGGLIIPVIVIAVMFSQLSKMS
jgi:hypothetical protein